MISIKKTILIAGVLPFIPLALLILTTCNYPNWYFDEIAVDAEFFEDGSCAFLIDGVTASDENYVQELKQLSRFCTGCTPDNTDGYFLTCELSQDKWDYSEPSLYVALITQPNSSLKEGTFEITESDNLYDHIGTHVEVLKPSAYERSSFGNGPNGAKLSAVRGSLELIKIQYVPPGGNDDAIISGHLSSVAQRRSAGW